MRKEDFFEVLGELDDDMIQKAVKPLKRKPGRKAPAVIAACLAAFLSIGVCSRYLRQKEELSREDCYAADAAPMVYVHDTLYIQSSDQQGYPEMKDEFVYLGKIEDMVSESGAPTENFQANHSVVGCPVYQYGENIVVEINGAYWLYMEYGKPEINWDDLTEQEKEEADPTYHGK